MGTSRPTPRPVKATTKSVRTRTETESESDEEPAPKRPRPLCETLFDELPNVQISCSDGSTLYVHSRVLLEGSEYWETALNGQWAEGSLGEGSSKFKSFQAPSLARIHIDASADVVRTYLQWRAFHKVALPQDMASESDRPLQLSLLEDLYDLAETYLDDSLRTECFSGLVSTWNTSFSGLVTAVFGDFVRLRPLVADRVIETLVGMHPGSVRSCLPWTYKMHELSLGPPTDPEELQRTLWAGVVVGKLGLRWRN